MVNSCNESSLYDFAGALAALDSTRIAGFEPRLWAANGLTHRLKLLFQRRA